MHKELLLHLDFILVLILVGSQLSNSLLSIDTLNTSLESVLLVGARLLEALDSRLSHELLTIDLEHDLAKALICLVARLLRFAQLLVLSIKDFLL